MQIVCPHCGFTKEIDDSKMPAGAKTATCPKCREKFELNIGQPAAASAPPPPPPSMEPEVEQPAQSYGAPPSMPETPAYQQPGMGAAPPPPLPGQPGFAQAAPTVSIPWENRSGSFFSDYFATVKMVLLSPGAFFSDMPVDDGYGKPITFAIVNGLAGGCINLIWQLIFLAIIAAGVGLPHELMMGGGINILGSIAGLVLSPIFIVIGLFIGAAIQHVLLLIVGAANSGYQATFRVLAYISPLALFGIVPILGNIVAFFFGLVLIVLGLATVHRTSYLRVIIGLIVIPFVVLILLAILAGILAAVFSN